MIWTSECQDGRVGFQRFFSLVTVLALMCSDCFVVQMIVGRRKRSKEHWAVMWVVLSQACSSGSLWEATPIASSCVRSPRVVWHPWRKESQRKPGTLLIFTLSPLALNKQFPFQVPEKSFSKASYIFRYQLSILRSCSDYFFAVIHILLDLMNITNVLDLQMEVTYFRIMWENI